MSDNAVLIFTKSPRPGQVKTRLIPLLGDEGAADFYTALLRREVAWIARDTGYEVELWVTPDARHPVLQELAERHGVRIALQQGADLGARMGEAAAQALRRHRRVVLIGVDCPLLTAAHLDQAFRWLEKGADAVLGPAQDGGYVLLGLNCWHPDLFTGHAWGGSEVAASTRMAMQRIGWQWRELSPLWDIDRPEDYSRFQRLGIELPLD